jgi:hypothetical protein
VAAAREALRGDDGQLPLTLLVLDEVQQYINEASDRAATITEVAEAVQTQFDSRIMLVGAGQSSLSGGTQALMWLRDRFKITIELADADVEAVTRKVLLRKKPSAEPEIESVLEANSGEIARHLRDTKIGQRSEDRRFRVGDYPLLPTRRRFWEACFQAADAAGTHSQLRSQLRILHDSLHQIAERELGSVLPASDLFNALAPALVNTGVLLNEINTKIQKLDDGSEDGRIRRDLCGLVFLVGKLPRESGVDMGVRATSSVLADLMVDDVTRDSGPFRKLVADTLDSLADAGTLMKVGEEFRLQTTEGAEWDGAFRQKQSAIRQSEIEISTRRDHLFGAQVQGVLGEVKLAHGAAKLRRSISLHVGGEPPAAGGDHVSVWLRDGWSCSEKDFISDARRLGQEDPTLHVFLPKRSADQLKDRIIDAEAARQVLDHYGVPASPEGQEARDGMESRLRVAEQSRDEIVHEIIRASKVLRGGGAEVYGDGLLEKIKDGANSSLARLFPRFDDGDHRGWEAAVKRAKDGSDEPLKVVGWDQPTEEHPVAKAVLGKVGSGARGSDVQKELKTAPFGWPQDAIDAVLIALHRSNHLRVTKNGQAVPLGALDQGSIKSAEFRPEKVRLTTKQRIELRGLFDKVGVKTKTGEEEVRAPLFLDALVAFADRTGGGPPLPPVPDKGLIMELGQKAGSEQLAAILEHQDDIKTWIRKWVIQADRCSERMPTWRSATALREHARGLPVEAEVGPELDAVREQRSLLADSDHVTPLKTKLATALRSELANRHSELCTEVEGAQAALKDDATWAKLSADAQGEVLRSVGLEVPGALSVADDEALQRELDRQPISSWRSALDAVPQRLAKALQEAASRAKAAGTPTATLSVRRGTLTDEAAVRAWLSEHEAKLLAAIAKGPVIIN